MDGCCLNGLLVTDRIHLVTAFIEIGGQFVFGQGVVASSIRPRKYYTIPKETTEAVLEDIVQLLDFGFLEFQRVLFVENVAHSVAV